MAIVALLDPGASVSLQVEWALWFARARRAAVTLLLPQQAEVEHQRMLAKVESCFGRHQDFCLVSGAAVEGGASGSEADAAASAAVAADSGPPSPDDERLRCLVATAELASDGAIAAVVNQAMSDLFLVLLARIDPKDERVILLGRDILPRIACSAVVVDLGDGRWPVAHLMVAASRGGHPRFAVQLARELAVAGKGRLTGAYVEPDIGSYARSVGRHLLDKVLRAALHDKAAEAGRHVVVGGSVEAGLQEAASAVEADAVVLGMPRPGLLGARFFRLVPARVCKRVEVPVIIHRRALPLGNRLRRGLEDTLQRFVPQVERETRVELSARVQSSSAWNFDFIALISLSTVIAALGLLQDSAAVIIGAMLIAPLMTPILGVGLALAQGNVMLARLAFRAIAYGVGLSFALAVIVGLLDIWSHPLSITSEMEARGWPGVIDLLVACASGLAAAYASSRPGLIGALPGVAIAAALVPPIATSGLAFAAGSWSLAYGSLLLFVTNMVAIVLSAGLSLWAVGVRNQGDRDRDRGWLRHLGNALVVVVLVLTVHLSQRKRIGPIPISNLVQAKIGAALPAQAKLRVLSVSARRVKVGEMVCTVQVGGPSAPDADLAATLRKQAHAALGEPDRLELQLRYVWMQVADK